MITLHPIRLLLVVVATLLVCPGTDVSAQTVMPSNVTLDPGSELCTAGSQSVPVQIALPPVSVSTKVDVFLLFDDTGSFADFVPVVALIFSNLVTALENALPGVEFGFGVGRFEDYGGAGNFGGEFAQGRPFTLNQPIVTAATAGSAGARNTLIANALRREAPGFGGDLPESAIAEGLFQVATGVGFDGNGNGTTLDSGAAGVPATQTNPGTSGDVPAFSSNTAPASGTRGGVGWRTGALRLVLLATDICPIAPFPSGSAIPGMITGAGETAEPVTAFACSSTTPGSNRFGFVSNSKTVGGNTVAGAVAPAGAATVQRTVNALNALGIRVLGMGPGANSSDSAGPSFDESVFLSALARLTGAIRTTGEPLVFSTSVTLPVLTTSIVDAISETSTAPIDIRLEASGLPAGLSFAADPPVIEDVAPGETAEFSMELTRSGSSPGGEFDANFVDVGSGAIIGTIRVAVNCSSECDQGIINDRVRFVVAQTRFDPGGGGGPAGSYFVTANLTNTSAFDISEPVSAVVTALSGGNVLVSRTAGTGGVGSRQAIDVGGELTPTERVSVRFEIGMATADSFTFFVNVEGCRVP